MLQKILEFVDKCSAKLQGRNGRYNCREEIANIARLIDFQPRIIVDGGANKGDWTAEAKTRWPNARFILFEPARTNRDLLAERHPDTEIIGCALSDATGTMTLYSDYDGSGIASLHQRNLDHHGLRHEAIETVEVTTLDEFCNKSNIKFLDILKLDIEGHELSALQGASRCLANVKIIQFEFGGTNVDSRSYFRDFWLLLKPLGFDIYRITPFGPTLVERYSEREECFLTTNFIAVRRQADSEAAKASLIRSVTPLGGKVGPAGAPASR